MPSLSRILHADVCVVGAGMVGLAHALEARRRGLTVAVLDRDQHAVGASVRNFGHLFFGSQPDGESFELALRARARWLELAPRAGLELVPAGTLVVARHEDELAVLAAARANPDRQATLLDPAGVGALAPLPLDGLLGGLHSAIDLRVDPRRAVAAFAALLDADPAATIAWGVQVHAVGSGQVEGTVRDHAGRAVDALTVRAERIVVAPGPDYRSLPPELVGGLEGLTRCRLQMLRVGAPDGRRYPPALATGLSLVRYPAFALGAEAAVLRARLERERPELLAHGIHLLVTQLPDGDLIIGDSHAYGDTLDAFSDERIDRWLLAEASRLLGADSLEVRERWLGVYATRHPASAGTHPFEVSRPAEGVSVVENVAGIGMTLSLGFAADVLDGTAAPAPARLEDLPAPAR